MDIRNQVEKVKEFEDAVWYKTTCDCGADEMSIWIEEEKIDDKSIIVMSFHYRCGFYDSWTKTYLQRIWQRIKVCCYILWHGDYELEGTFMFRGEEHIRGVVEALKESADKLSKRGKDV